MKFVLKYLQHFIAVFLMAALSVFIYSCSDYMSPEVEPVWVKMDILPSNLFFASDTARVILTPGGYYVKAIIFDTEKNFSADSAFIDVYDDPNIQLFYEPYIQKNNIFILGVRAAARSKIKSVRYALWENGGDESVTVANGSFNNVYNSLYYNGQVEIATTGIQKGFYDFSVTLEPLAVGEAIFKKTGSVIVYDNAVMIKKFEAVPQSLLVNATSSLKCEALSISGLGLTYDWSSTSGTISGLGSDVTWTAPDIAGDYDVTVNVSDGSVSAAETLTISVASASVPTITADPLNLAFGDVEISSTKDMTFTLGGTALTDGVFINGFTGYTLSKDGTTFANNLTYTAAYAMAGQTVTVRFSPSAEQDYSGNIVITSSGASTMTVALTGVGIAQPSLTADFTSDVQSGDAPLTVNFTDVSTASGTTINSWSWDFDNDGTEDSNVQNPSFEYTAAGTYTVALTVGDGSISDTMTKTNYITVNVEPTITADFEADNTTGTAPFTVNFTDLSTATNPITSWSWDFGDGNTSTSQNPQHVFSEGTYTVALTVSDGTISDAATKTNYITVNVEPTITADFTSDTQSGDAPLTVQFTDASAATGTNITSRSWDFDNDGTEDSNVQNPSFEYTAAGTYTVALTVSDGAISDTMTKTNYITVSVAPTNLIEDFEDDLLDPLMSFTHKGTFNQYPEIKPCTNFGSEKAFGFGKSNCGASCFDNYQTRFFITFSSSTYIDKIEFDVMELDGDWGSSGNVYIDGIVVDGVQMGNTPSNDNAGDSIPRKIRIDVYDSVQEIEILVSDITNKSEIFIDDILVSGIANKSVKYGNMDLDYKKMEDGE